jgi:hypothetical protein
VKRQKIKSRRNGEKTNIVMSPDFQVFSLIKILFIAFICIASFSQADNKNQVS